jgi:hypothetical protein
MKSVLKCLILIACTMSFSCSTPQGPNAAIASLLLLPDAPEMNHRAPERFNVRLETTKGEILI